MIEPPSSAAAGAAGVAHGETACPEAYARKEPLPTLPAAAVPHLRWLAAFLGSTSHAVEVRSRDDRLLAREGAPELSGAAPVVTADIAGSDGIALASLAIIAHPAVAERVALLQGLAEQAAFAIGRAAACAPTEASDPLQGTNERLRLIVDNAPVLIYVVGDSGRFLSVNRAWERVVQREYGELVGRHLTDVFAPEIAREFIENNRRVIASGRRAEFEEQYAGRTYLSVKVPVRDTTGRAYAICGLSVDITERKEAERELYRSQQLFREMADGLPLIIWVHGPQGEQQFVNQTFCDYFGVSRDGMSGEQWATLLHPEDRAAYVEAFTHAVRTATAFHREARVRTPDGQWRWIESWARPRFNDDGTLRAFIGTSADVTDRKETSRRLESSESVLREADRRKDLFLAALSHELRNPLAPIRNAAELLKRKNLPAAAISSAAGMIERQSANLEKLVEGLLDLSRVTLGKASLQLRLLDLREPLGDAIEATSKQRGARRQEILTHLPAEPCRVTGDRLRLFQVFSNLLGNASRYTPEEGHIEVRMEVAHPHVLVHVSDDGRGIDADELPRIFELFHQIPPSAEEPQRGLGIGLTLVKAFVEMHGGSVSVASEGAGRGSTFTVRLGLAGTGAPRGE